MVLGHGHSRRTSLNSNRSSAEVDRDAGQLTDDETVVDSDQSNVLTHIISQLRPGADLSRITLPTFILEPRSMLERITNFMAHPETLLPLSRIDDPVERFVAVVKFYLSGWHIKPPGVKKPLNPILGETFTGYWDYPDGTRGYYIAEQTSHHPPKSSYFFEAPEHNIRIDGTLKPRSKFLGNSAASMMEGIAILRLLNKGERYFITQPNMYARGILFGKMRYELGDHSFVKCPESGLTADLEFKTKGYFGGTYDAIGGFIKDTRNDKNLYELSGLWTKEMYIKNLTTGRKELIFDASNAKPTIPATRPLDEQHDRESQKLWQTVMHAIKKRDQVLATDEKSRIEDMQREEARKREDDGVDWHPALFRAMKGSEKDEADLDWILAAHVDGKTPEERTEQILNIAAILPGQHPQRRFSIPDRKASVTSTSEKRASKGVDSLHPAGDESTSNKPQLPHSVTVSEAPPQLNTHAGADNQLAGNTIDRQQQPHKSAPSSSTIAHDANLEHLPDTHALKRTDTSMMNNPYEGKKPQELSAVGQPPESPIGANERIFPLRSKGGSEEVKSPGTPGSVGSGSVVRHDTERNETDEFFDAES